MNVTHCLRVFCAPTGDEADNRDFHTECCAQLLQHLRVSRSLVPKSEAFPHHNARNLALTQRPK